MTEPSDRELGIDRPIDRRDFLNGMAWSAAAASLPRSWLLDPDQSPGEPYPPGLSGLRGSHDGAFEIAHQLRDGAVDPAWLTPTDLRETYDLAIVGAGISGLAAAHFFRQQAGPRARILILDNHDDFGGHARRNEFTVDGTTLIGYGGTQSIDTPSSYSPVAKGLLTELGIDVRKFETAYDQEFEERHGLGRGYFFDKETFGVDRLVVHHEGDEWRAVVDRFPLDPLAKGTIVRLYESRTDHLAGRSIVEKKQALLKMSYAAYLLQVAGVAPAAMPFFQRLTHDLYGVGIDAISALDCRSLGFPGFDGLGLDDAPIARQGRSSYRTVDEPYIYHFPDGNASIARLLVRRLVPGSIPGSTMEDVVTARARYGRLDRPDNACRIRLGATVVRVTETGGDVRLTYVRNRKAERVRARRCVLACWHGVIPHLCPELPAEQKAALKYGVKVPLLYTNVAVRNWKAFAAAKVAEIRSPSAYWLTAGLDFPVSLGSYRFTAGPDQPAVLFLERTPCKPGLPERDQHRAGRLELLATPFATYEREVRGQLARMLGGFGFDPARDIAGITVNRWSHGYTYEYNALWDPVWEPGKAPHEIARRPFGRITFANADAAAFAYTNASIDEAHRAVGELMGKATDRR
ncbi:MAG: NAD(P)-binding protein [Gemmatimonadetes bacterium]|nr:NAD(P)-binding protein [Gemmatimonadota bacterium]